MTYYKDWQQVKALHKSKIVFTRVGDFYETYHSDAELVAKDCNIVLTSRPVPGSKTERMPLAGFPHHAKDYYVKRLRDAGHEVALIDKG